MYYTTFINASIGRSIKILRYIKKGEEEAVKSVKKRIITL